MVQFYASPAKHSDCTQTGYGEFDVLPSTVLMLLNRLPAVLQLYIQHTTNQQP